MMASGFISDGRGIRSEWPPKLACVTYACALFCIYGPVQGQGEAIPRENRNFERVREPNEDDTPGALVGGGYCWRDVTVIQRSHRAVGRAYGGATVETITHSSEYPYVIHDFFGTFFGGGLRILPAQDMKIVNGVVRDGDIEWKIIEWVGADGTISGRICVNIVAKKEGGYAGNLGWYTRDGDRIKTVMMFYDNVDGVPAQLVDEFLKQYPSSLKEEDFHGRTWVAEDVRKWLHLLELLHGDRDRFGFALNRLASYDDKLFGVDRAKLGAGDPAVFQDAMDDLRARAERWLADREKKKRSRSGD